MQMNIYRGRSDGHSEDVILLPPVGERIDFRSDNPVTLRFENDNDVEIEVVNTVVEPDSLGRYIDFSGLTGMRLAANKTTDLKQIGLKNEEEPAKKLEGRVTLILRYVGRQEPADFKPSCKLVFVPFPKFPDVFAVDFGNTSSTFVTLPNVTRSLFQDASFRALNLDAGGASETVQRTAVQFRDFGPNGTLERWEVGNRAMLDFNDRLIERTAESVRRMRGFMTGGIKRRLGETDEKSVTAYNSEDASQTPIGLSGDELNGLVLRRFVRRCEEGPQANGVGTLGRVGKVVATHPVNYTPLQIRSLRAIYGEHLGIEDNDLVCLDEATASAIYHMAKQIYGEGRIHLFWADLDRLDSLAPAGHPVAGGDAGLLWSEVRVFNMLVFDCGGGTTDIGLLQVEIERQSRRNSRGQVSSNIFEVRPRLVGLTGLKDFAGDNMTLATFRLLRFHLTRLMAMLPREIEGDPNSWSQTDRESLTDGLSKLRGYFSRHPDPAWTAEADRETAAHAAGVFPTDFGNHARNPTGPEYRLRLVNFYRLWDMAERFKIALSKGETAEGKVPPELFEQFRSPGDGANPSDDIQSLELHRADLDLSVEGEIVRAWNLAADLCADLEGERVHQVVLSGNGSRYPLIKRHLRETFAESPSSGFDYQEHRVLEAGDDAKFACAKGAAISQWYRNVAFEEHRQSDMAAMKFRNSSRAVLPFPIMYQAGESIVPLFDRGESFPEDPAGSIEKELPAVPVLGLYQGLRQHKTVDADRLPYCQFQCEYSERPPGVPDDANPKICVRVDRQYRIAAELYWEAGGTRLSPVSLTMIPFPTDTEQRRKDPFLGFN